ncbi:ROK family protein [Microbacterium soli]
MVPLELDGSRRVVIAVHLGAVELRAGIIDIEGRIITHDVLRYEGTSPAAVSMLVRRAVAGLTEGMSPQMTILGMGATIGGWVDPHSQTIIRFDPLGWRDVNFVDAIPDLGYPRWFDQIVRGIAVAESLFGVARGHQDFVVLWSGHILGSASVWGGSVQRGVRGGAGMIDHLPTGRDHPSCVCGQSGCLGMVATDQAILDAARAGGIPNGGVDSLRSLFRESGEDARLSALIRERAADFGRAARVIAQLRAPELFVIAGLITTHSEYEREFRRALHTGAGVAADVEVRRSEFGGLATIEASAALVIDDYYRDPMAFEASSV